MQTFSTEKKLKSRTTVVLLLLTLGLWAFVAIADNVMKGDAFGFDRTLLLALRNPANLADPIGPEWFEEMVRDVTALGGIVLLTFVSLIAAGFLMSVKKRRAAVFVLLAITLGELLSTVAKVAFNRPRPDLVSHGAYTMSSSFPSGHSMMSAVVYITLGLLLAGLVEERRVKIFIVSVSVLLTLAVGASRVYLGVHWPSDVLAGWCAGAAVALTLWMIELRLQRRE